MTDEAVTSPAPTTHHSSTEQPRLAPIENPSSWWTRLAYALCRWEMGTVITPMKVVWSRMPGGLRLLYEINKHEERLSLDPELRLLVKKLVATVNGCSFCQDIAQAQAYEEDVSSEKFEALLRYETHPVFDEAERAALAYAEEVAREVDAENATFDALQPHFDEQEIVELTWVIALESYYNILNRPLGIGSDHLCELQS